MIAQRCVAAGSALVVLFGFCARLSAASFPPAVSDEIPVSAAVFGAAPDNQYAPLTASTGEVGLLVWKDKRGGDDYGSYASRVDSAGRVLDPLGIRLPIGAAAVSTEDGSFVVLGADEEGAAIVTVRTDGVVGNVARVTLPSSYQYYATAAVDGEIRFLFLDAYGPKPVALASIVRSDGTIAARDVPLSVPFAGLREHRVIAGSRGSEFLILRLQWSGFGAFETVVADVLSANGELLSTIDSKLAMYVDRPDTVIGGDDGYLFIKQADWATPSRIAVYRLDRRGVFTGSSSVIDAPGAGPPAGSASVRWDGSKFMLVWTAGPSLGHSGTYVCEVRPDGSASPPLAVHDWVGIGFGASTIAVRDQTLVATSVHQLYTSSSFDLFVEKLNSAGASAALLVSGSCTLQGSVRAAAGNNGYLVGWAENGPDRYVRLFVRRVSQSGVVQDVEPLLVETKEQSFDYTWLPEQFFLASNGDVYLVAWQAGGTRGRRLDSRTGAWIDEAPFDISGMGIAALASNGEDALAILGRGIASRRINLHGAALTSPEIVLADATSNRYDPQLTSNGHDYLLVWSDGYRDCPFECVYAPFRLLASRLAVDGTPLGEPIAIDDSGAYPQSPSVAWTGSQYIVEWVDSTSLRATRLTNDGLRIGNPRVEATTVDTGYGVPHVQLRAHRDRVVMFVQRQSPGTYVPTVVTRAVTFAADTQLADVAALPRQEVLVRRGQRDWSIATVVRGDVLMLGYERLSDASCGGVPRAVVRLFGEQARRRSASPR